MPTDDPRYPIEGQGAVGAGRPAGADDLEHLRLLSIFHYIVGGLAGMFALFPVLHLAILGMVLQDPDVQGEPVARVALGFALGMIIAMIVAGLTFAVCLVLAGRNLARQTGYTFCLVMAALACLLVPLGTVLGVFTILVLLRPTVKERFARASASG